MAVRIRHTRTKRTGTRIVSFTTDDRNTGGGLFQEKGKIGLVLTSKVFPGIFSINAQVIHNMDTLILARMNRVKWPFARPQKSSLSWHGDKYI